MSVPCQYLHTRTRTYKALPLTESSLPVGPQETLSVGGEKPIIINHYRLCCAAAAGNAGISLRRGCTGPKQQVGFAC